MTLRSLTPEPRCPPLGTRPKSVRSGDTSQPKDPSSRVKDLQVRRAVVPRGLSLIKTVRSRRGIEEYSGQSLQVMIFLFKTL